MKVQKDLKYMASDKTYETLVLVKYFKFSVLTTCLTIFSIPDFASSPKGESEYIDSEEYKDRTRLTKSLVSLLEVFSLNYFVYSLQASIFLCSMGNFWHHETDNAAVVII